MEHAIAAQLGRGPVTSSDLRRRQNGRLASIGEPLPIGMRGADAGGREGRSEAPLPLILRRVHPLILLSAVLMCLTPGARAQQSSTATYSVTFQGNWTTASTPGGVVGGAHFTTLIGAVHNDQVTFWESGGTATPGVERVAELGSTGTFKSEINANSNALSVIEQSVSGGGTGSATFNVTVTSNHSRVTLLSMIGPSPDWFVGISGRSLLNAQGNWQSPIQVDLFPYDAGTEDGTDFSLSNPATSPQGVITSIRGTGKFSNVRMARLTFTLQSVIPPQPPPPPPGGGGFGFGGGGGAPRTSAPSAPRNLMAVGGDGQVVLTWEPPLRDGGTDITDYEYRIDRMNPWVSTGSSDTTHTVSGLVNGATYLFEVRAVNRAGKSFPSNRVEATPTAPEPQVFTLDFPHFANGGGITSEVVLLNVGATPIRPVLYFSDRQGKPIAAGSVVEVTDDLEIQQDDGGLTLRTAIEPLGELTVATHGLGEEVSGSVRVMADGAIGGVLRYGVPGVGVTGVGAGRAVRDALFPARRKQGGIRTAAALHNLGEEAIKVNCELMSGGEVLEEATISLEPNGQASWFLEDEFTMSDTTDFAGTVRCTAPGEGRFTGLAVEVDAANRIFTTLPVVPVERRAGEGGATVLYFAHFANGGNPEGEGIRSELVFVNVQTEASRPAPTPFHKDIPESRPVIYFYDREGRMIDPESVVDLTEDLEVSGDDGLTVRTEMEPLGELTVATHCRGEEVSGSVKVVSEGAIGGVLRYSVPGIGVTGVGTGPATRDALFPARHKQGGIRTAAALRNLGGEAMDLTCRLMSGGAVLEETTITLEPNGQTSWFIEDEFTATDTTDFAGTVRCTAPGEGKYTGLAVEVDAANRIFTTLPVVPLEERMPRE